MAKPKNEWNKQVNGRVEFKEGTPQHYEDAMRKLNARNVKIRRAIEDKADEKRFNDLDCLA